MFDEFNKLMVAESDISNIKAGESVVGYEFNVQYPSYRGTFLSCIEAFTVDVDGEEIAPDEMAFFINGKEVLIEELHELFREYWFILDYAKVRVYRKGGLPQGSTHKVHVFMKHRIPYTGYFGNYMVLDAHCQKELAVG